MPTTQPLLVSKLRALGEYGIDSQETGTARRRLQYFQHNSFGCPPPGTANQGFCARSGYSQSAV